MQSAWKEWPHSEEMAVWCGKGSKQMEHSSMLLVWTGERRGESGTVTVTGAPSGRSGVMSGSGTVIVRGVSAYCSEGVVGADIIIGLSWWTN